MNGWVRGWVFISIIWSLVVISYWSVDYGRMLIPLENNELGNPNYGPWVEYGGESIVSKEESRKVKLVNWENAIKPDDVKILVLVHASDIASFRDDFTFDPEQPTFAGLPEKIVLNWSKYLLVEENDYEKFWIKYWWKESRSLVSDVKERLKDAYNKEVASREAKLKTSLHFLLIFLLIPIVMTYFLGFGVAWVRDGFKAGK